MIGREVGEMRGGKSRRSERCSNRGSEGKLGEGK